MRHHVTSSSAAALLTASIIGVAAIRVRRSRELSRPEGVRGIPPDDFIRTADGAVLAVVESGSTAPPLTVLLVHGWGADHTMFRRQLDALNDRVRVITLDLRGHGRSGWTGPESATMERLAQDLGELIDQRVRGPLLAVGHSLGGMALLTLLGRRPDLAKGMVGVGLVSTSAGRLARAVLPRRAAALLSWPRVARVLLALGWGLAPVVRSMAPYRRWWGKAWLAHWVLGPSDDGRDHVADLARARAQTPRSVTSAFYPALVQYDAEEHLPTLRSIPTLVLAGAEDRTIPPSHGRCIAQHVGRSARFVLVPGAGHALPLTHPGVLERELALLIERALEHASTEREAVER